MTTRTTSRPRILTADRLYTAGIILGSMLIPHLILGVAGDWPIQAFNLHLVAVLLLVGFGWHNDTLNRAARDDRFEQITRYLEDQDGR